MRAEAAAKAAAEETAKAMRAEAAEATRKATKEARAEEKNLMLKKLRDLGVDEDILKKATEPDETA